MVSTGMAFKSGERRPKSQTHDEGIFPCVVVVFGSHSHLFKSDLLIEPEGACIRNPHLEPDGLKVF
jgi:hypothetical protein